MHIMRYVAIFGSLDSFFFGMLDGGEIKKEISVIVFTLTNYGFQNHVKTFLPRDRVVPRSLDHS